MSVALQPWHLALALSVLFLVLYGFARAQFERAREAWANAFFYSPSLKTKQRQRRQRWQDTCWALLTSAIACALAAGLLYLRGPR